MIRAIFKNKGYFDNHLKNIIKTGVKFKNLINQKLRFIPPPRSIKYDEGFFLYYSNFEIVLININSDYEFIKEFFEDIKNDFGINIVLEESDDTDFSNEIDIPFPENFGDNIKNEVIEERYRLYTTNQGIIIQAEHPHGLFNAFQTLYQIFIQTRLSAKELADFEGNFFQDLFIIPRIYIDDYPEMPIRGVADDVSRGQIPTIESAKRMLKQLSRFKINYYAFYIEDVFTISKHPRIGKDRGGFTPNELAELDKFAQDHFILLFPIFETLGHVENILMLDEYEELGEFPGAQCLALANGEIYPFLKDFIEEFSACLSSRIIHLGGDETFDLGYGKSKFLIEKVGYARALYDHFIRLYRYAKQSGFERIILYHDVIAKYPEILPMFPKDITIMYWNYAPQKSFKTLKKLKNLGMDIIVSPSTLAWTRAFPDFFISAKNIIYLIKQAKSMGLSGVLNSNWGDFANQYFRENNVYGHILALSAAWMKDDPDPIGFIDDIAVLFYGILDPNRISMFRDAYKGLVGLNSYSGAKFALLPAFTYPYLYRHPFAQSKKSLYIKKYRKLLTAAEEISELIKNIRDDIRFNRHFFNYFEFGVFINKVLAYKEKMRDEIYDMLEDSAKDARNNQHSPLNSRSGILTDPIKNGIISEIESFKNIFSEFIRRYHELWLNCAKYPNLEFVEGRFNRLLEFCDEKIDQIKNNIPFVNPMLPGYCIWDKRGLMGNDFRSRLFRKEFIVKGRVEKAVIQVIAGNVADVFINGEFIGRVKSRGSLSIIPLKNAVAVFDISSNLHEGKNVIAIEAYHYLSSIGSLHVLMEARINGGSIESESMINLDNGSDNKTKSIFRLVTDNTWVCSVNDISPFLKIIEDTEDSPETSQDNLGEGGESEVTTNSRSLDWTLPDYKCSKKWHRAKIIGTPSEIFGHLYYANLIEDQKCYPDDFFGMVMNLYYILAMFLPKSLTKIITRFYKRINKVLF